MIEYFKQNIAVLLKDIENELGNSDYFDIGGEILKKGVVVYNADV